MAITLGDNQYGKAGVRLVRVARDGPRHELRDLTVSVALAGDLAAAHQGDNSGVLPTDTQKNTVYAFAKRYGVGEPEAFGLLLARHFVDTQPTIHRARVDLTEHPWSRLGPHSFARDGGTTRHATVTVTAEASHVVSGLSGLVLLNTTDSEFHGYVRDGYTTLPEATDRILATEVQARWRWAAVGSGPSWSTSWQGVRDELVAAFVETYSYSLQQTLYAMGSRALEKHPEIAEVRLTLPNKHHFLVDLAPFGLGNDNEVYVATDRPYGLIEGTVLRDDVPPAPEAW
ncbi:factor-independent urate hydroxylase [Asanoa siamensis]|uniref:Uricase n=1 Tax=Asanoa siamensis TaxID=926357 RepID=A0ABQ4CTZ8_9ACTN|nr:urate oxidase [Asanoa siamensis]GIF74317.1 uricase [Asanoa siamensis]